MSRSYFQFKQFCIHQDRAAMKVSTDACIQGAWTPIAPGATRALDMGSGTGLLALFLAQRAPHLTIDALEIHPQDAEQGRENFEASPWADRLHSFQGDHSHFQPAEPYDLLCTNPPFFVGGLPSEHAGRSRVKHLSVAQQQQWIQSMDRLLGPKGNLSILYPADQKASWAQGLEAIGLHLEREVWVSSYSPRPAHRIGSLWTRDPSKPSTPAQWLYIYQGKGQGYTQGFMDIMKEYYLYL